MSAKGGNASLRELSKRVPESALKLPTRLSRNEQRVLKDRQKAFENALRAGNRSAGWKLARGTIYRQQGDWFVSNTPRVGVNGGAWVSLTFKPMNLDPIFWEI